MLIFGYRLHSFGSALRPVVFPLFFFYRHFNSPTSKWWSYPLGVAREAAGDADGVIGVAVPAALVDVAVDVAVEELDHDYSERKHSCEQSTCIYFILLL